MTTIFDNTTIFLLPILLGICIFLRLKIQQSNSHKDKTDELIRREMDSVFIRDKSEIPKDLFLETNKSLPFDKIELNDDIKNSISRLKEEIENLQKDKIIKHNSNIANIELKEQYGVNNLDLFIKYEKNYNKYIINLNEISNILMDNNQLDIAEIFLLEAKNIGSDFSKTYINLIDIYNQVDKNKLDNFIKEFAETNDNKAYHVIKALKHYEEVKMTYSSSPPISTD